MVYYFIAQKVSKFKFNSSSIPLSNRENIDINIPTFMLQRLFKKTLMSVGIGFLILFIIIVIASKFKIALLFVPISFYLIGQYFVFSNHIKAIKNQKINYNIKANTLTVSTTDGPRSIINLSTDNITVKEVKTVQKNNGVLMGYFILSNKVTTCYLPYLLVENAETKPFFDKLQLYKREVVTKLFPII